MTILKFIDLLTIMIIFDMIYWIIWMLLLHYWDVIDII
jgi:hypothetical protein